MAKKIVNKSVSFNVIDPFQRQMKEHVEQYPNFSAYIKRLIQRDMEGGSAVRTIKKAPAQAVTNLSMTQLSGLRL
ncbi:hypothetical protein [Neobacillus niacini]|uniref:hypothetical protein n=1 Tax=Neobacillus niacini TaxID=86668 RepID=UPI002865A70C|nr:hypothetical protein [Neobacillus niacini]MDR7001537.1 hypothetical protein [Neobacillus niacini]